MNPTVPVMVSTGADWHGAGAPARASRGFDWQRLLWALVFPAKRHRTSATVPGLFLIALALGIGTAAYNTASNILFLTLSLLLACLLLSGLLSWFNLAGVGWRLRTGGPWRAGHDTLVTVGVRNTKTWLPSYGLWFDLLTHPVRAPDETAVPARRVREVLAEAEKAVTRGRIFLRERLDPRGETEVAWVHRPARRGAAVVELEGVGSLFPFGFLRKSIGTGMRHQVVVWPAQVEYQWKGAVARVAGTQGRRTARQGVGEDLFALRRYQSGDSHRLVHWKASARLGQLMVRQFAAESADGFTLRVDADARVWTRPEQFELLCSFAATLAEDLFAAGRLRGVGVGGRWIETRRVRDVEMVLDLLAVVECGTGVPPAGQADAGVMPAPHRNLITFAPEGARGITAHVDGIPTASA